MGNVDGSPASSAVTVDVTRPTRPSRRRPTATRRIRLHLHFQRHGSATGFECRIDADAFAPCTSPHTTPPATGRPPHVLRAGQGCRGHLDPSPDSEQFTVTTVAPDTLIDSGPTGRRPTTLRLSPPRAGDKPPPRSSASSRAPTRPPALRPALHQRPTRRSALTASTRSPSGHGPRWHRSDPATSVFTLDRAAPQTTIPAERGRPDRDGKHQHSDLQLHFHRAHSTFECQLDASPSVPGHPRRYTPGARRRAAHLQVRATDQAGNRDLTEASAADDRHVAPTLTISGPALTPPGPRASRSPPQDGGTSFACQLDAAPAFTACSSPYTVPLVLRSSTAPHVLRVQVRDAAGNLSAPATHSFTVDATLPIAQIDSGPTIPVTNATSATFTFSVTNEPGGATFECKLDAADYAPCSSPQSYPTPSTGSHTFRIRATDAAGNLGTPVSYTWSVNTGLPQTTIDSAPPAATTRPRPGSPSPLMSRASGSSANSGSAPVYSPCNSPQDTRSSGQHPRGSP